MSARETIIETLTSCIRGMICAPAGRELLVADYSAIEARTLPWLAGQDDILEVFRGHGKIYEYVAQQIYGIPWQEVGKESEERFIGKVACLALGYAGGAKAFQGMAEAYGADIPEDLAETIKKDWREANDKIVKYWYDCEKAAINAVRNPGKTYKVRNIAYRVIKGYLFAKLPSGRCLAYYQPRLEEGKFGNDQITFMGTNSVTRKWERQSTYSGKLVENLTQAVARDIMAEAIIRVEDAGYEVVLSVHDELVAEVDEGFGSLEEFEELMCVLPPWAAGLPLDTSGYKAKRYRK